MKFKVKIQTLQLMANKTPEKNMAETFFPGLIYIVELSCRVKYIQIP